MTGGSSLRRHIGREALVSAVINGILSLGFAFLVFSDSRQISVWSAPGFLTDFVPQGFMIGLMASFVPALLARRAALVGRLDRPVEALGTVRRLLVTAGLTACVSAVGLALVAAAILAVAGWRYIGLPAGLIVKTGAGAALGALATTLTLTRLLAGKARLVR